MSKRYVGLYDGSVAVMDDSTVEQAEDHLLVDADGSTAPYNLGGGEQARLARAILIDALGNEAKCYGCGGTGHRDSISEDASRQRCWDCKGTGIHERVTEHVDEFVSEVISKLHGPFEIDVSDIRKWIAGERPWPGKLSVPTSERPMIVEPSDFPDDDPMDLEVLEHPERFRLPEQIDRALKEGSPPRSEADDREYGTQEGR